MRIFITGCKGQLGAALFDAFGDDTVAGCDLPELDITDRREIHAAVAAFRPDAVIHAAAWTDVDGCARDPDRAYFTNGVGTQNVALSCAECEAAMLYVSTNEVFSGDASEPYREWDPVQPLNPYGRSKAAGEWYTSHLLKRFYIARTAWLYDRRGRNFPHRILELADTQSHLRVVADEIGNPTYAPDLAVAIRSLLATQAYGVYHLVNSGIASRYDFAHEILHLAGMTEVQLEPIHSDDFARASTPPRYAPLANTAAAALGIELPAWQDGLARFLSTTSA
jgi:dTDP-4-dehydrorhamnose reductase